MAGEIIIEEYGNQIYDSESSIPKLITTQPVTIGSRSAALNAATAYIVIQSNQTAAWVRAGDSSVNAVIDTAGNLYIPSDGSKEVAVIDSDGTVLYTHVDTVADA